MKMETWKRRSLLGCNIRQWSSLLEAIVALILVTERIVLVSLFDDCIYISQLGGCFCAWKSITVEVFLGDTADFLDEFFLELFVLRPG